MPTMGRTLRCALFAAAIAAVCTLAPRVYGQISADDAELQYQLANLLIEETRYDEALQAFDRAAQSSDRGLALRARKGKVKTALRLAEFELALAESVRITTDAPSDPEALSLHGEVDDQSRALARQTYAEAFALMRQVKSQVQLEHHREMALNCGLGPHHRWKSREVRGQVWCAMRHALHSYPSRIIELDEGRWEGLTFRLAPVWAAASFTVP